MSRSDTAPVRQGEELNLESLATYLRAHLPSLATLPAATVQVEQFTGGHSNLTYMVRFGAKEFVLRRPPVGPVAPTAHDMPREFRLLETIHPHFPLAPQPVLLCEDARVIGVPFYLMELRRGLIVQHQVPHEIGDDANTRRRVSEAVVDTLASLHAVDIFATDIVRIGKPEGFVSRQVHGWSKRWERSRTSDVPEMDHLSRWLSDNMPAENSASASIVHNDFKLDNIVLNPTEPWRVVAVLDWEMCSVGDPLIDLGLFLCYWTMKGSGSLRAVTTGAGWLSRIEILDRYQQQTNRDVSKILFYETFARFKVAVIIQQIYFRFARGQTHDERFRNFDQWVLQLARAAATHL